MNALNYFVMKLTGAFYDQIRIEASVIRVGYRTAYKGCELRVTGHVMAVKPSGESAQRSADT